MQLNSRLLLGSLVALHHVAAQTVVVDGETVGAYLSMQILICRPPILARLMAD